MKEVLKGVSLKQTQNLKSARLLSRVAMGALALTVSCAQTPRQVVEPVPVPMPAYVKVPHPEGLDGADLLSIFTDAQAPTRASLVECDEPYRKLLKATTVRDEWLQGARELVRAKPVEWHWCFYQQMLLLEERLKNSIVDLEDRQKAVIETFSTLTPLARAFWVEYGDSRYLRWATHRYRRLSEFVFFRRLDLAPDRAIELSGPKTPFGSFRPGAPDPAGVLARYGIGLDTPPVRPATAVYPLGGDKSQVPPGVTPAPVPSVVPPPELVPPAAPPPLEVAPAPVTVGSPPAAAPATVAPVAPAPPDASSAQPFIADPKLIDPDQTLPTTPAQ